MNDSVVAIVSAFFIIGITVGIIAVVAMSALRADRRGNPSGPLEYGPRGPGHQPSGLGMTGDDAGPNDHTRWPGDAGSDFNNA